MGSSSCGIPDSKNEFLYITGHWESTFSFKQVIKYDPNGKLDELPELKTGRFNHACAGYYQEDNFVLIIAGGMNISGK